jgi:hypothetical protein
MGSCLRIPLGRCEIRPQIRSLCDLAPRYGDAGVTLPGDLFNIADVKWNDFEYYYVSRLKSEASPAADMSFILLPRTVRAYVQYQF